MKGFRVIQEVMHPNGGVWEVILGHDHFEFLKKTLLWINIRKTMLSVRTMSDGPCHAISKLDQARNVICFCCYDASLKF